MSNRIRASFEQAASSYDQASIVQAEIGERLLERLQWIRIAPECVMDLGTGTGRELSALQALYPDARIVATDLAENMLKECARNNIDRVCTDVSQLGFQRNIFDLLFSNLMLQWCGDLLGVFQEIIRVLSVNGLLMFSTFGPDTLQEYKAAWSEVDQYAHVNDFIDMHDVGDALMAAGFQDPVMDVEYITVTYENVDDIVRDLRGIGSSNVSTQQTPGLMGKQRWAKFRESYEQFRNEDGLLPLTYEVVYGHAWKGEKQGEGPNDEVYVPVDSIR